MREPWRELVEDARWAPSPHNLQSWLLRPVDARQAELLFDPDRLLRDTDPDGRFITVGLGCFVESLAVAAAARGLRLDVDDRGRRLDPTESAIPVAALGLFEATLDEPLDAELLRARRTSRLPFDGEPVGDELLCELAAVTARYGHRLAWSSEPALLREVLALNERTLFHDIGHVVRFPALRDALREHDLEPGDLAPRYADLPLLFLYGRSDDAVPYFGCKVTPANVEEAIFSEPALAESVTSFALLVSEDEQATKRLAIALELRPGATPPADVEAARRAVLDRLAEVNQDYREAARFIPPESVPTLELHPAATGPFAGYDVRLKRHYVQRA